MKLNDLIWHPSVFSPLGENIIFESLPESLAKAASIWPKSIAIVSNEKTYNFQELAERAAGLAEEISEAAIAPGPIALLQSLDFDAIAAWFACSIAGRPFVLLEPDHPPARLLEIIENSRCALVIGDHKTSQILLNFPKEKFLISDGRMGIIQENHGLRSDEPAMIFPTSGSTGKPKLIVYSTKTMQVKVQSSIKQMQITLGARVMIASSHGNYGFLHHALVFLLSGGSLCLADIKSKGFDAILQAITQQGARHVRFTPSLFRKLAILPQAFDALSLLDGVRFSGEPLLENDLRLAKSLLKPESLIQNIYGSTESALFIWSNTDDTLFPEESTIPIGKIYPHASYAIRPLENKKENNGFGELLIRSAFHALGDLHDGKIHKERFTLFEEDIEDRVYATGDIVQQKADGNLIHLGRMGRMVKIRGNRVFLTEVENEMRSIPGVNAAAVVERKEQETSNLYGFISAEKNVSAEKVHTWLASRLPDYMIPKSILLIPQIPLLAGGKVDYMTLINQVPCSSETPINILEKDDFVRLCTLWDSILWKGAHRQKGTFFALGGDSLSLMMLSVEIEQHFGHRIPLEEFRENSTLSALAAILQIETPPLTEKEKNKKLDADFFWPSLHTAKGVALAMPAYDGWSTAYPFKQAGFMDDHDIWVVNIPLKGESLLDPNKLKKVAFDIVEGIQAGTIPTPNIIFGYSFAGGLAWLVSRLLADTPHCPKFVIMVDAPALHRLEKFKTRALTKALNLDKESSQPTVIHIRRQGLPLVGFEGSGTSSWNANDPIQLLIELPTVDHLEMQKWNMLEMAKDTLNSFLNNTETSNYIKISEHAPDLLGVHIFRALNGCRVSLAKVLAEFTESPEMFQQDHFLTSLFLMALEKDAKKCKELMCFALKKWPNSRIIHYLNNRISRNPHWLFSENIPKIYPLNILAIEISLARINKLHDQPKAPLIKDFILAFDVLSAMIKVEWRKRIKHEFPEK